MGLVFLFGGITFVASSLKIPDEMRHISNVKFFNFLVDIPLVAGMVAIGISAIVVGLRTLRHVVWKATKGLENN